MGNVGPEKRHKGSRNNKILHQKEKKIIKITRGEKAEKGLFFYKKPPRFRWHWWRYFDL